MKNLFISTLFLVILNVNAQEIKGKAEYFSKRIVKSEVETNNKSKDIVTDENFKEALRKASEKNYVLTFNKKEALYEQKVELEKPKNDASNGGFTFAVSFSGEGKKYISKETNQTIEEDDVFGKDFLVVDPLIKYEWKLLAETKQIGEYTCMKAEVVIPVTEKQKRLYQENLELQKKNNSTGFFSPKEPKDKVVTAWYTPDIPVSFGPMNYHGLPGLILELSDGEKIVLCNKITISNKENFQIEPPKKGEKVSRVKFDEIQKKKFESMQDENGNVIFTTKN
jgi:GLPGLI family protein